MTDPIADATAAAAADDTAQTAADAQAATDAQTATDAAAAEAAKTPPDAASDPDAAAQTEADAAAEAEKAKQKPKAGDRRFAHMTARSQLFEAERDAALRRAEAAEALVRAGAPDGDKLPPAATTAPATDVETRARQIVAEEKADARRVAIVSAGEKEFGEDEWNAKAAILKSLGATDSRGFMTALLATENGPKIVAHFAEDENADELSEMLNEPATIGVKLGRMDAALSKPAVRTSNAPKPATRVDAGSVLPVTDIYDPKISNADLDAELDKRLPPHLGGKRKAA